MVVLEGGGMLTSNGNQYLQPDYLSPLPTTLDAKKSPLALLAQTCSQIGADSPSAKPLISTLDKPKKSSSVTAPTINLTGESLPRASPAVGGHKPESIKRSTPDNNRTVAFKPYENTVTKKSSDDLNVRPSSKLNSSSDSAINSDGKKTPCGTKSASPSATNTVGTPLPETGKSTPSMTNTNDRKSTSPTTSTSSSTARGASPIIRSGLEILQGHPKDLPLGASYKPGGGLPSALASTGIGGPLSALCCPPGFEHAANPAFRPPFAGGPFSHHHAAAAAAMLAASGYPPSAAGTPGNPYVSYARVKTPSGGEALVPVCKDPYCTGCQFSMHNQQLLMGAAAAAAGSGPCPSGCTQCDHQKYGLAAMAMSSLVPPPGPIPPPSSLGYPQLGSPYICNWIAGESYCGKRFRTSEELLQHLRTHTASTGSDSAVSVSSSGTTNGVVTSNPLLNPLFSTTAALHRAAAAAAAAGYPNPPLSPLSAARYHPYAKPGLPSALGASPYSAFNPTPLSPYYSPYSLYGQRIGAAVHP